MYRLAYVLYGARALINCVAVILRKQEDLKTQKEKDIAIYTIYLINPALIITTLEATSKDPPVAVNCK